MEELSATSILSLFNTTTAQRQSFIRSAVAGVNNDNKEDVKREAAAMIEIGQKLLVCLT